MIRALGYSLIAAATLTACSGNDVKDTFAGIPVTSNPEGATVYVGRQKIGVTPMNIPDSAWERPGGTSREYWDFESGGTWVSVKHLAG